MVTADSARLLYPSRPTNNRDLSHADAGLDLPRVVLEERLGVSQREQSVRRHLGVAEFE